MKSKGNIILLIIAILFLCVAIFYVYDAYNIKKEPVKIYSNNNITPTIYNNFKVFDKDEKEINLEDNKDKPVLVLFWKTDNPESVELLKKINERYENYKDKIVFMPISMSDGKTESIETVENFLQFSEITIPMYYDLKTDAKSMYNVKEIPTIIFIKKDNTILNKKELTISDDALDASLDILAENY